MKISSEKKVYAMGPDNKPIVIIKPGDTITVETLDCYSSTLGSENYENNSLSRERINPATGPIYIDSAKPGDTLAVYILDILVDSKGLVRISPEFGVLKDFVKKDFFKIFSIHDGIVHFSDNIKIPINPMIGVIGTSPADKEVENSTPGEHGGNMDTHNIAKGSIVYLPVNVEGGLLSLGDIHASMGDGEVCGTGVETCAEVCIRVDVISNTLQKRPYIETEKAFYTISSAPTLEEALKIAVEDATILISNKLKLSFEDAYMLTSIVCNARISQVVNPLVTVRMEIPKELVEK